MYKCHLNSIKTFINKLQSNFFDSIKFQKMVQCENAKELCLYYSKREKHPSQIEVGAHNATYELAVAIIAYLGFISTMVIASGCIECSIACLGSLASLR